MYHCALSHCILSLFLYESVYMFEIFKIVSYAMPIGLFTTFSLFVVIACTMKVKHIEVVVRRLMFFYCISGLLSGILFYMYYYYPDLFRLFDVLYFPSVIFTMVIFHHFFRFAIGTDSSFNLLHYWVPLLTFIGFLIVKFLFPQFWFKDGMQLIFVLMLLWSFTYSLLPVIGMHQYSIKQVLISGTEDIINKYRTFLFISEVFLYPVTIVLFPLVAGPKPGIILSVIQICCIFVALRLNIPLAYAVIRHYTSSTPKQSLFESVRLSTSPISVNRIGNKQQRNNENYLINDEERNKRVYRKYTNKRTLSRDLIELDRKEFERYFRKHKPYLKPDLTINELAAQLQSNRTYVSKFINRVYGMNFNSYLNYCRLHELARLQSLSINKGRSTASLIQEAGFGNYRSYMRAKTNKPNKGGNIIV